MMGYLATGAGLVLAPGRNFSRIPAATSKANDGICVRGYNISSIQEQGAHIDRMYLGWKLWQATRQTLKQGVTCFLGRAIPDISGFISCFLNGCLDNVDLELLFRQAKMAWESDAAKMTLVSNDQKPHFMTWDGVAG